MDNTSYVEDSSPTVCDHCANPDEVACVTALGFVMQIERQTWVQIENTLTVFH